MKTQPVPAGLSLLNHHCFLLIRSSLLRFLEQYLFSGCEGSVKDAPQGAAQPSLTGSSSSRTLSPESEGEPRSPITLGHPSIRARGAHYAIGPTAP